MARLVSAVITPDDHFDGECTTEAALARLSHQDQKVLHNIANRIAALEVSDGPAKAEAALVDILALLSDGRLVA